MAFSSKRYFSAYSTMLKHCTKATNTQHYQLCKETNAYRGSNSLLKLLQILKQLVKGQLTIFFPRGRQPPLAPLPHLLTAATEQQVGQWLLTNQLS